MDKFGKSQPVRRFEDQRFLTGEGRYVDDITPDGALHAFVLRSPVAHARIRTLDVSEAAAAEGVELVLTAGDLDEMGVKSSMDTSPVDNKDGTKGAWPVRPFLATDKVHFVGEPVALVVARTLAQAKDAAELIEFDFEDLPVSVGLEPGGPFEQCAMMFAPVLRIGSMTIVLGLGVLALLALIAGFNIKLAREGGRSIQASTGMFYLAVILAPAVEFAAKVRFF